jgi:hypothetical protein
MQRPVLTLTISALGTATIAAAKLLQQWESMDVEPTAAQAADLLMALGKVNAWQKTIAENYLPPVKR